MPDDDPLLELLDSEFAIYQGRPQHRPTYDTGRKHADGTSLDEPRTAPRMPAGSGDPTTRLIFERIDGRLRVRFEKIE